jgi:hypothetical protein
VEGRGWGWRDGDGGVGWRGGDGREGVEGWGWRNGDGGVGVEGWGWRDGDGGVGWRGTGGGGWGAPHQTLYLIGDDLGDGPISWSHNEVRILKVPSDPGDFSTSTHLGQLV